MAIKDEIRWIKDIRGIEEYFARMFQEFYRSDYPQIPVEIEGVSCN